MLAPCRPAPLWVNLTHLCRISTFTASTSSLELEAELLPSELLLLLHLLLLLLLLWLQRCILGRPLRTAPSSWDSNLSCARGFGCGLSLDAAPAGGSSFAGVRPILFPASPSGTHGTPGWMGVVAQRPPSSLPWTHSWGPRRRCKPWASRLVRRTPPPPKKWC